VSLPRSMAAAGHVRVDVALRLGVVARVEDAGPPGPIDAAAMRERQSPRQPSGRGLVTPDHRSMFCTC
jgi:hypothetical protein